MKRNILLFNVAYYFIIILLFLQGKSDPSSSLGIGILILGFWAVALIGLLILVTKRVIVAETALDKVGVFTATPVLCLLFLSFPSLTA